MQQMRGLWPSSCCSTDKTKRLCKLLNDVWIKIVINSWAYKLTAAVELILIKQGFVYIEIIIWFSVGIFKTICRFRIVFINYVTIICTICNLLNQILFS